MSELLTAAQMRAIETAAMASGSVSGLELMERAGRGVVEAIFENWPKLAQGPHRALVLCGPGNNGGDGFVVARLLRDWGWDVDVFLYGQEDKLPPDARTNCERWLTMGPVRSLSMPVPTPEQIAELSELANALHSEDLIIDAFFGTGLGRSIDGLGDVLAAVGLASGERASRRAFCVGVDIPSGLCSDSGRVLGDAGIAVCADLTVSFHALKAGHMLADGPARSGRVVVKSIGLAGLDAAATQGALARLYGLDVETGEVTAKVARLAPRDDPRTFVAKDVGHKYAYGHALVLSGGAGQGGAGRLAARAALRIGAGLVTLGCPPEALHENAAQLNAVMLTSVKTGEHLSEYLASEPRLNALCLGPGLGLSAREHQIVSAALNAARPTVLDADALSLIAQDGALMSALHDRCVLTPHAGEFARLFPDIATRLNAIPETGPALSKIDATREAAERAGCTVLFKGPDTVIADPSGWAVVNSAQYDRAAPWLATAGSGDVLAGFIAGLLARGLEPLRAAEIGAWLHVECARAYGPGLIAEDLAETLPAVMRSVLSAL